jgi:hypothetical protein
VQQSMISMPKDGWWILFHCEVHADLSFFFWHAWNCASWIHTTEQTVNENFYTDIW